MSEPLSSSTATLREQVLAGQRVLLEEIARAVPLPTVLGHLVELVERSFGHGATAAVMVLDHTEKRLWVASSTHLPEAYRRFVDGLQVDPDDLAPGLARFFAGPIVTEDIASDPHWEALRSIALEGGLRSCWSSPLASGEQPLGLFTVYFPLPRSPDDEEGEAVDVVAATAALAVDRQRVEASRQAARRWETGARDDLQFVLDATTALGASLDRTQTVRLLAELAVPRLAPLAVVDLIDGDRIDRAAVVVRDGTPDHVRAGVAAHPPEPDTDTPVAHVLASGKERVVVAEPGWMPALVQRNRDQMDALEAMRATGYACFPLTARGTTFGVLSLLATADDPLEERVVRLGRDLADRAALAIDNAELYARRLEATRELEALNERLLHAAETQRQVALSLQHAMLPAPSVAGSRLEVAVRYRPADDELAIGGDWYDVLVEDEPAPWVSVAVGDVVGKGLAAAGVMGQLRSALRAASYSVDGPAASLRVVDRYARTLEGAFATTVVKVRLHLASQSLRYASAGHPPPLLVDADGRASYLCDATQPPLGVDGGGDYIEASAPFGPGSLLVLYSDGLVERRDRDIDEGLAWLSDVVVRHRLDPVEELADVVLRSALLGVTATDDTVLVVVRSPSEPRTETSA